MYVEHQDKWQKNMVKNEELFTFYDTEQHL